MESRDDETPRDAASAQPAPAWIDDGTPVSAEVECEKCGNLGIAAYSLGSVVYFEKQLAAGRIHCKLCDSPMRHRVEIPAPASLRYDEKRRSNVILLP